MDSANGKSPLSQLGKEMRKWQVSCWDETVNGANVGNAGWGKSWANGKSPLNWEGKSGNAKFLVSSAVWDDKYSNYSSVEIDNRQLKRQQLSSQMLIASKVSKTWVFYCQVELCVTRITMFHCCLLFDSNYLLVAQLPCHESGCNSKKL